MAPATVSLTSFTPAETADRPTNARLVAPAMRRAKVVLPVPGRRPEHGRAEPVGFDERPQGPAGGQQVLLPYHLVETLRPHPGGQRALCGQAPFERGLEEVSGQAGPRAPLPAPGRAR